MYSKRQFKRDRALSVLIFIIMILSMSMLNIEADKIVRRSIVPTKVDKDTPVDRKTRVEVPVKPNRYKWVDVTGYCLCKKCCGKWSGTKKMKVGQIAASRSIPFGTRVKINGKIYVVNDRLAKKYDKRMDIYFRTHKEALAWGKKRLKVRLLN